MVMCKPCYYTVINYIVNYTLYYIAVLLSIIYNTNQYRFLHKYCQLFLRNLLICGLIGEAGES